MTSFYNIVEEIKKTLINEPFINTVTYGNITEVDLNKRTIFPLAHINVENANYNGPTWTFDINILVMDIVDISNEAEQNNLDGNDNGQDILNTQLAVVGRFLNQMKRGTLAIKGFELQDGASAEPFEERFHTLLTGWSLNFSVEAKLDISIC